MFPRKDSRQERTAEERARAAAERAARRRGEAPPAAPPVPGSAEPVAPQPSEARSTRRPPEPAPGGADPAEPQTQHVAAEPEPAQSTAAARSSRTAEWVVEGEESSDLPPVEPEEAPARSFPGDGVPQDGHEPLTRPMPAAPSARRGRPRAAPGGRQDLPPLPSRRRLERTSRRTAPPPSRARPPHGRGPRRILALIALVAIGFALWAINAVFQPFHAEGTGSVGVSIPAGADAGRIGEILAEKGVVDNGRFFDINATLTLRRGKLRPGDYTLPRNMSYGDAIEALMQGPKAKVVPTFSITIPEGRTRREIVPIVKKTDLEGDYARASVSRKALTEARELGLPRSAETTEGFLFPATYELIEGAPVSNLVDKQLEAFGDSFGQIDLAYAKRRNLTRYDVVIIASMVEREAQLDKERPLVAAVIYNRLREGIPLGIDATIRYDLDNWSRPLRVSELERDTPYNTRLNRGLPPTPIGNPGKASLEAAARPAKVDYLFYVVKPGTCGEHAFSSTDAQFQRDVARYNAEREKAGGKSPTTC